MKQLKLLPLLLLLIVNVDGQNYLCYDRDGKFTSNETYGTTLDTLLRSIITTTSGILTYGLFNVSASRPQDPDDIQVLGVCSGDVTGDDCRVCLSATAFQVRQLCPTNKQATLFEKKCGIRYSSSQLYGVVKTNPYIIAWNTMNASDQFVAELKKLLDSLRDKAALGGPFQKYATGNSSRDLSNIYGQVQCSPDLSYQQCSDCLVTIIGRLPGGKKGGMVLSPSCRARFETYHFFDAVAVTYPPPPPDPSALPPATTTIVPPPLPGSNLSKKRIIVGASSGFTTIFIICILVFLIVKRKKRPRERSTTEVIDEDVVTADVIL